MTAPSKPRPIRDLDVTTPELVRRMAQQRNVQTVLEARLRTGEPSDLIAYALDVRLIEHPEAPVSTDADYAGWAEHIAALAKTNKQPRRAS